MALHFEDPQKLVQEISRLQQEKKNLNLRVQGVEVLGKVLQQSQEENSQLRQEVKQLQDQLQHTSLDDQSNFSISTTASMQQQERCFLSKLDDNSTNSQSLISSTNTLNGPASLASVMNSHTKDLSSGFKTIKNQSELLLQQAVHMNNLPSNITDQRKKEDLTKKLSGLVKRLEQCAKDARTRQTFSHGLANQEEQLKEKVIAIENEQFSQEKVMEDLQEQLNKDKKELESVHKFYNIVAVSKDDINFGTSSSGTAVATYNTPSSNLKAYEHLSLKSENAPNVQLQLNQLDQVTKEKNEALRQKEELLDVNHAWDVQYRKLKTETGKEIADLRHQVEILRITDSQKRLDKLWLIASKNIDEERMTKQHAMEEKKEFEERCIKLEKELHNLQQNQAQHSNGSVVCQIPGFSPSNAQPPPACGPPLPGSGQSCPTGFGSDNSSDIVKEIEVLKQQLRVYADDFTCERQDRERMQSEKEKLEKELKDVKEQVPVLEEQLRVYEEDFRQESQEKDRLRRQLQTNFEVAGDTEDHEMTRKAQAVAERQARLRVLREQYGREERQLMQSQQDLQQHARTVTRPETIPQYRGDFFPLGRSWAQQQGLRARGPVGPVSDDMFHGGEVQADTRGLGREVADGANQENRKESVWTVRL